MIGTPVKQFTSGTLNAFNGHKVLVEGKVLLRFILDDVKLKGGGDSSDGMWLQELLGSEPGDNAKTVSRGGSVGLVRVSLMLDQSEIGSLEALANCAALLMRIEHRERGWNVIQNVILITTKINTGDDVSVATQILKSRYLPGRGHECWNKNPRTLAKGETYLALSSPGCPYPVSKTIWDISSCFASDQANLWSVGPAAQ